MSDERERGKELATILSSDDNFIREINSKKNSKEKIKYLACFLRDNGLLTEQNPLTMLSVSMCAYTLETQYKIDVGCGDWKMNTDEDFLKEVPNGISRITPIYNQEKKK